MLGKKQSISNADWIKAMTNAKVAVSKSEITTLAEATINNIKEKAKNKKVAFAWSGGKDSIILAQLCKEAEIIDCMIGICNLEYPAFMAWIEENKPEELEIINTGQDMAWLKKHQDMLFPDSKKAARWFSVVQHVAQTKYYKKHNLDMLLVGRRKADGNFVGKSDNIYTNGKGVCYYSPLAVWTHEQSLAYIAHNNLPLPPIYDWENGYKCGTHPWPARQHVGNAENGWREIYSIDPNIVRNAALHIESAKVFLETENLV